jgi:nicotinamide mononucleotide adenylyltransferase
VLVPCTGRLQPEHLLKALEQGADAVCIIACDEANCHHAEGSCRARRRAEFVGKLVEEIGLGAGRVMLFHLPGSAREDMALGAGDGTQPAAAVPQDELAKRVKAIRNDVISRLNSLAQNPLRTAAPIAPADGPYEVEETDDSED